MTNKISNRHIILENSKNNEKDNGFIIWLSIIKQKGTRI